MQASRTGFEKAITDRLVAEVNLAVTRGFEKAMNDGITAEVTLAFSRYINELVEQPKVRLVSRQPATKYCTDFDMPKTVSIHEAKGEDIPKPKQSQKHKPRLVPALRHPGSCRNDVRVLLRNEPGLSSTEVLQRLPGRSEGTVRANLSVLVKTGEAEVRDGRYYYIEEF